MSLSSILTVGIGLILIYYALGLIVNATTQIVKISLDMRADALSEVLGDLLLEKSQDFMQLGLIQTLKPLATRLGNKERDVADIPNKTFSLAILEFLQPDDNQYLVTAVQQALNLILDEFAMDEASRKNIETLLNYDTDEDLLTELRAVIRSLPDDVKLRDLRTALLSTLDLLLGSPESQLARIRAGLQQLPEASKARKALENAINFGVEDIDQARTRIEAWYDDAMKNVRDLYSKRVRRWVIFISLIVTLVVGGDTIALARSFLEQPIDLSVVDSFLDEYPLDEATAVEGEPSTEQIQQQAQLIVDIYQSLEELQAPIPWWRGPLPATTEGWFSLILGLMFTWLAVSQGSSFWYDILKAIKPGGSSSQPQTKESEKEK